jgi:hypothetical protein
MLVADQRLAQARAFAGLPARDVEFHHDYPPPRAGRRPRSREAAEALARARLGYRRLSRPARMLDERLESRLRAWQLADRGREVEATEAASRSSFEGLASAE